MKAPGRVLLCLVWIGSLIWLAVSLSDMRALARAAAPRSTAGTAPAALAAPIRESERAGRLRPADTEPLIERARLLLLAGRGREAKPVIEDAVRQEPRNARAWVIFTLIVYDIDHRPHPEITAHVEELDPRGTAARRR